MGQKAEISWRRVTLRGDQRGVHVHDPSSGRFHLPGGLLEKHAAGHALPLRIGVRKEAANVRLAKRAEHGVADGVQQDIGVRMPVEPLGVGNVDAAENAFSALDQLMNIVSGPNVNHGRGG